MGMEFDFSDLFDPEPARPRQARDTKERIQKAKRQGQRREIRGGIADAIRRLCEGGNDADR